MDSPDSPPPQPPYPYYSVISPSSSTSSSLPPLLPEVSYNTNNTLGSSVDNPIVITDHEDDYHYDPAVVVVIQPIQPAVDISSGWLQVQR